MDRRVKERLVGASILVVLIVMIVPELLSGPAPLPATSGPHVTVDLATSKATASPSDAADTSIPTPPEMQRAVAAGAVPAAAGAVPAATADGGSDAGGDSAPVARLAKAPPAPTHAMPPANPGGAWAVQLGSFASRANADKLVRRLKAQGFSVYAVSGGPSASVGYRVRVGPVADRGAAAQTAARLKALGYRPSLVPPAP